MSAVDDIKLAMAEHRANRKVLPKGAAIYALNRWKGEESRKLRDEYERRKAAIEAGPDDVKDEVGPEVLTAVAEAAAQGISRSSIRIALGKQTMEEADEIIKLAVGTMHEKIESGEAAAFTLRPTDRVHAKGWPMYMVTMHETDEAFGSVYLVTTAGATQVARSHMRISPSPAGSQEILDRLFEAGVGAEIFRRGKD